VRLAPPRRSRAFSPRPIAVVRDGDGGEAIHPERQESFHVPNQAVRGPSASRPSERARGSDPGPPPDQATPPSRPGRFSIASGGPCFVIAGTASVAEAFDRLTGALGLSLSARPRFLDVSNAPSAPPAHLQALNRPRSPASRFPTPLVRIHASFAPRGGTSGSCQPRKVRAWLST